MRTARVLLDHDFTVGIELRAGLPPNRAKRGSAYDYNISEKRAMERARVEAAEQDYATFTSRWRAKPRTRKMPLQPK